MGLFSSHFTHLFSGTYFISPVNRSRSHSKYAAYENGNRQSSESHLSAIYCNMYRTAFAIITRILPFIKNWKNCPMALLINSFDNISEAVLVLSFLMSSIVICFTHWSMGYLHFLRWANTFWTNTNETKEEENRCEQNPIEC